MSWWNNIDIEHDVDSNPDWWFIRSAYKDACKGIHTIYNYSTTGYVENETILPKIEEEIFRTGAKLSLVMMGAKNDYGDFGRKYYTWIDGVVEVCPYFGRTDGYTISAVSTNKEKVLLFKDKIGSLLTNKAPVGRIKMMASGSDGVSLTDVGTIDQKFVKENYTLEIQKSYQYIKDDLSTKDPSGRIILLDGEPGTGKSYFIRGLVSEVEAWYVYVPSALVGQLSGPGLVRALAGREDTENLPTVLIIEDADTLLVKRQSGDANRLAELLNMSDGIFGDLADLRILASTNAKRMDMDEALLRPGRLSRHVHFDKLAFAQANEIYKRLTGRELVLNATKEQPLTLAEVYMLARGNGWIPPKIKKTETHGNFI